MSTAPKNPILKPVLLIGGSGVVGSRAARALRRLQPGLPIVIGARDLGRADALAGEIGGASSVAIDLERRDLGLPGGASFSAIVAFVKDPTLHSLRYAQAEGVPFVSFSDWAFDIAPEVTLHIHHPRSAPVLLLGHMLGGTVLLPALHFAREFARVDAIELAGVFDEDDVGGPAALTDWERLTSAVPRPLLRRGGRWQWPAGDDAVRSFRDARGIERQGRAVPLLDVVSLAAATGAAEVRFDLVLRAGPRAPAQPSVEIIIEITGQLADGTHARARHEMLDDDLHSGLSSRGPVLAVERLLGLDGGPLVPPGLYHPESILDPARVVDRLREFGTRFRRA